MRKSILNNLALAGALISLAGCSTKQNLVPSASAATAPAPREVSVPFAVQPLPNVETTFSLNSLKGGVIAFNTVAIKAKAALSIDQLDNDINLTIRVKNEQAIWISVTALAGLEMARILISPDSIKIMNRVDNTYTRKPFSFIHQYANEQINYKALQDILLGNTPNEFLNEAAAFALVDKKAALSGRLNKLNYEMQYDANFKLLSMKLTDMIVNQSLHIGYGKLGEVSARSVPHTLSIQSNAANNQISGVLDFSKVEFDLPVEMPFNVPQRFVLKN